MEAFPAWYLILVIFGPFVIGALVILAGLFLWRRSRKIALAVIAVPLLVFLAPPLVGWVQFKLDDYYLRSLIVRAPEASLPKGRPSCCTMTAGFAREFVRGCPMINSPKSTVCEVREPRPNCSQLRLI
jgi:hypothetical protein